MDSNMNKTILETQNPNN